LIRSIHCFRPPELAATEPELVAFDPVASLTRRRFLAGGGLVLISAALGATAGCGRSVQLTPLEHLPANPQRIVVGNTTLLDALLALGAPVIGAPTFGDRDPVPSYLASRAAAVQSVGTTAAPDLETVAALEPDLILIPDSPEFRDGVRRPLLIAPVAAVPALTNSDWQTTLRSAAALVNRVEQAETLLRSWDDRVAGLRAQFTENPPGEASVVRYFNSSARYLPGGSSFAGQVLDEAGVPRPANQRDAQGRLFVEVSLEEIEQLDGDLIFVITVEERIRERFERQPLWQQLRAVQAGRVYPVDQHWFSGNILAAHAILDDLERYLAP
jgi:iron complex transport system substrate-binding protein